MQFKEFLDSIDACDEALEWVGDRDAETAWAECDRPDWLAWLTHEVADSAHKPRVRIALECARLTPPTHPLLTDSLHQVERWLAGESIDLEEAITKAYNRLAEAETEATRRAAKLVFLAIQGAGAWDGGDVLEAIDCARLWDTSTDRTLCEIVRRHLPWSVIGPLIHAKMEVA